MKDKIIEQIEYIDYYQCKSEETLLYKFVLNVSIMSDDAIPKFKNGHVLKIYRLNQDSGEVRFETNIGGSYKQILEALKSYTLKGDLK